MLLKEQPADDNWSRMLSGFLAKEEREVLNEEGKNELINFSKIRSLMDNQKKEVRDSAAFAFNDILNKHVEVAEAEINSILLNKKMNDELRKMHRPDLAR